MPTAPQTPPTPAFARHLVTAVLVAHNGARWLPQTAGGLRAQTRPPQRFVAVDTGSSDDSAALLAELLGPDRVVAAPLGTGFGAAVARGIAATDERHDEAYAEDNPVAQDNSDDPAEPVQWLWLLHDDAEPEPDALERLLGLVDSSPTVAVAGPKIRGWANRRVLLEVGVTIARSGRRETGLERREQDQGQQDGVHDVLAVSTAGMLVRRDVWETLRGLDPVLALYRDDVDFGWRANSAGHRVVCVTDAVVHHAAAASHSRRRLDAFSQRRLRVDRQHANYVLLANLPLYLLPWTLLRLTLGTLVRATGLLVGKLPANALGEVLALAAVLARPDRLVRARWVRRRTRTVPFRVVRRLLASPASGLRHGLEAVTAVVGVGAAASYAAGRHRAVESGPGSEDAEDLPSWGGQLARRVLTQPPVLLLLVLGLVTAVAARELFGAGRLMGGALLPAPDSAGDLWRTYTEGWHPVGLGSDRTAPPYLALVAALGTLLLGSASAAVSLLLVGAVPLAGLTCYLALRRVVDSATLRGWAAGTYALLPPLTGAVAAGRVGTAAAGVLLPLGGLAAWRALGGGGYRAAWASGLLLAVLAAFVPLVYLLAVVLGLGAIASRRLRRRALARLTVIVVVPPVLLMPWLPGLVADPQLLLLEGGFAGPGLVDPRLHPAAVFLVHPGGPGMYPLVFTAGLLLAALSALLRPDRRRLVVAGWATALVGIGAGVAVSHVRFDAASMAGTVPGWPGPATLLAGAGLVLAAAVGADGARARIARSSFGWRQVVAVGVTVLAAAVPILAASSWALQGADDPVQRRDPVLLPAFVAAEGDQPSRPRTLVLRRLDAGRLSYALLRADGPRLGDADTEVVGASSGLDTGLGEAVADLASGRGGDAAADLLPYGVRFVLLGRPVDDRLAGAIDAVPGLVRLSSPDRSALWKVRYPSGRARLISGAAGTDETVLRAGPVGLRTPVPPGTGPRLVTLADRRDPGWQATLDGRPLAARTHDRWAQAFALPPKGGLLVVRYDDGNRPLLLWLQGAALLLVIVLALPSARSAVDTDEAAEGAEPAGAAEPAKAAEEAPR